MGGGVTLGSCAQRPKSLEEQGTTTEAPKLLHHPVNLGMIQAPAKSLVCTSFGEGEKRRKRKKGANKKKEKEKKRGKPKKRGERPDSGGLHRLA